MSLKSLVEKRSFLLCNMCLHCYDNGGSGDDDDVIDVGYACWIDYFISYMASCKKCHFNWWMST